MRKPDANDGQRLVEPVSKELPMPMSDESVLSYLSRNQRGYSTRHLRQAFSHLFSSTEETRSALERLLRAKRVVCTSTIAANGHKIELWSSPATHVEVRARPSLEDKVLAFVRRQDHPVSIRELQKGLRHDFRTARSVQLVVDGLVKKRKLFCMPRRYGRKQSQKFVSQEPT